MKKLTIILVLIMLTAIHYWTNRKIPQELSPLTPAFALKEGGVPVEGMVTLVDIGSGRCTPCKMMAPILEELRKEYEGCAAVIFFDIRANPAVADRFRIRAIPTQVIFDAHGRERFRHEGYMEKEALVSQLQSLGIEEVSCVEKKISISQR